MDVKILCFGPLAEQMGWREKTLLVEKNSTIESILVDLEIAEWLNAGLRISMNDNFVDCDTKIQYECEIVLLPPVSGG